MKMKFIIFLFSLCATINIIKGSESCTLPITIYKDLKCLPEYDISNSGCPIKYDCSHIYKRTEGTCHFKGKFYKKDEVIDEEDERGSCQHQCRCETGPSSETQITCPRFLDGCPEKWRSILKPFCYFKYELNRCCAAGQVCPPFDDIAKCNVNGKVYTEGQLFNHPTQKCVKCVCQKDFAGKFEKPFCQDVQCFAELKNSRSIDDNCAPFYSSPDTCCPDKWVCPSKNGKFLPAATEHAQKDDLKCKFGTETVPFGGSYVKDVENDEKIYCECQVPPLLTCGPLAFTA